MTELPRDFGAVQAPNRLGWFAWYQAPEVGTCWITIEDAVTRENGKRVYQAFPTKTEAEIAAARAKDAAEDRGRQPRPRTAKIFRSTGQGRSRRAVLV